MHLKDTKYAWTIIVQIPMHLYFFFNLNFYKYFHILLGIFIKHVFIDENGKFPENCMGF